MSEIKWTREFVERLNKKFRAAGVQELIIHNGKIYRNEICLRKGEGILLERD